MGRLTSQLSRALQTPTPGSGHSVQMRRLQLLVRCRYHKALPLATLPPSKAKSIDNNPAKRAENAKALARASFAQSG